MATQPEALRLAERFEDVGDWYEFDAQSWFPLAAAELRRLHALNAELTKALRRVLSHAVHMQACSFDEQCDVDLSRAREALAKAE